VFFGFVLSIVQVTTFIMPSMQSHRRQQWKVAQMDRRNRISNNPRQKHKHLEKDCSRKREARKVAKKAKDKQEKEWREVLRENARLKQLVEKQKQLYKGKLRAMEKKHVVTMERISQFNAEDKQTFLRIKK